MTTEARERRTDLDPIPSVSKESAIEFYQQVKAATLPYMPTKAKRTDWETPKGLFDSLWEEFGGFDMDPACQWGQYTADRVYNAGGTICFTPPQHTLTWEYSDDKILMDGLAQPWHGKVFLNPPYGRGELEPWIEKAVREVSEGRAEKVVALLPARTGTKWFQRYVLKSIHYRIGREHYGVDAHEAIAIVRFLPGRLTFEGAKDCAPFPSVIVVWSK